MQKQYVTEPTVLRLTNKDFNEMSYSKKSRYAGLTWEGNICYVKYTYTVWAPDYA